MPFRIAQLIALIALLETSVAAQVESIGPHQVSASSLATVVRNRALRFSNQILPSARAAHADAARELDLQVRDVLMNPALITDQFGVAKLNVYVAPGIDAAAVQKRIDSESAAGFRPAISFVTTRLPQPHALVAMDSVSVATPADGATVTPRVLALGPRVFISGQAEKGDGTLADATAKTMAGLLASLQFLGLDKRDVVQVKCFLTPMNQHLEARRQIEEVFRGFAMPALAMVEWKSSLPIEIEIVANGARIQTLATGPTLEFRAPPDLKPSPVFSRIAIVRHPQLIFTSGVVPLDAKAPAESQVRSLFAELKKTLDLTGSDWSHLAKATYYVSDDEVSKWHNAMRPEYFNPRRPPAASKAAVSGVGFEGHHIALDIIAIPAE